MLICVNIQYIHMEYIRLSVFSDLISPWKRKITENAKSIRTNKTRYSESSESKVNLD